MPSPLVQRIIRSAAPSLQLIEKIASAFHTSLSAAAWRYCDLAKEQCAIVWSGGERIHWSKRSETFALSLRKGTPLNKATFAWRALTDNSSQAAPRSSCQWLDLGERSRRKCEALGTVEGSASLR